MWSICGSALGAAGRNTKIHSKVPCHNMTPGCTVAILWAGKRTPLVEEQGWLSLQSRMAGSLGINASSVLVAKVSTYRVWERRGNGICKLIRLEYFDVMYLRSRFSSWFVFIIKLSVTCIRDYLALVIERFLLWTSKPYSLSHATSSSR